MRLTEGEFEQEMNRVDEYLQRGGIDVPGRPIQAAAELMGRFRCSGPICHPHRKDLSFPVTVTNASDHVSEWYRKNYGSTINVDPTQAQFPLLLEGTVFRCKVPLIFGSFRLVASKHQISNLTILNAVEYVQDLPPIIRSRLSSSDEGLIQTLFFTASAVADELRCSKSPLLVSAKTDIHASCDLLLGSSANTSQSAWQALQFAEKTLKEFISHYEKPRFTHNIRALVEVAEKHGYRPDPALDLDLFSFSAEVRYDPNKIAVTEAININHEAWKLAFNVLKQWRA